MFVDLFYGVACGEILVYEFYNSKAIFLKWTPKGIKNVPVPNIKKCLYRYKLHFIQSDTVLVSGESHQYHRDKLANKYRNETVICSQLILIAAIALWKKRSFG